MSYQDTLKTPTNSLLWSNHNRINKQPYLNQKNQTLRLLPPFTQTLTHFQECLHQLSSPPPLLPPGANPSRQPIPSLSLTQFNGMEKSIVVSTNGTTAISSKLLTIIVSIMPAEAEVLPQDITQTAPSKKMSMSQRLMGPLSEYLLTKKDSPTMVLLGARQRSITLSK